MSLVLLVVACSWRGGDEGVHEVATPPAAVSATEPGGADDVVAAPWVDVVLLGTGTPVPDPRRAGPATAVVIDGLPLLFDAGPNVVRQAQAAADRHGLPALSPENLHHVFLTHLHSDHTTGLPDVVLGAWVLGRSRPLRVVGPPGTKALVDGIRAGWAADIAIRQGPGEELPPEGIAVDVVELRDGGTYPLDGVTVRAVEVPHGTWDVALGYVIDAGPRRVVISGDTAPSDALMAACDGCDLLVHEVYSQAAFDVVPSASFRAYHSSFHTSGVELGLLATKARAKQVALTHLLLFGSTPAQVVGEVKAGFDGPVVAGEDLLRLTVGR